MVDVDSKKKKNKSKTLNISDLLAEKSSSSVFKITETSDKKIEVIDISSLPSAPRSCFDIVIDESIIKTGPPYKIFVGNIPFDVNETDLRTFFGDEVNIISVSFPQVLHKKGYAYIDVADVESLRKALHRERETKLNKRTLKIDFADPLQFQKDMTRNDGKYGGYLKENKPRFTTENNPDDWKIGSNENQIISNEKRNNRFANKAFTDNNDGTWRNSSDGTEIEIKSSNSPMHDDTRFKNKYNLNLDTMTTSSWRKDHTSDSNFIRSETTNEANYWRNNTSDVVPTKTNNNLSLINSKHQSKDKNLHSYRHGNLNNEDKSWRNNDITDTTTSDENTIKFKKIYTKKTALTNETTQMGLGSNQWIRNEENDVSNIN